MLKYIFSLILLAVLLPSHSFSQFEVVLEDFGFSKGPSKLYRTSTNRYFLINDDESEDESKSAFAIINDEGEQELGCSYENLGERIIVGDFMELSDTSFQITTGLGNYCSDGIGIAVIVYANDTAQSGNSGRFLNFGGIFSDNSYMLFHNQPGLYGWERRASSGGTIWYNTSTFHYPYRDMLVTSQDTIVVAESGGLRLLDKDKNTIGSH